MRPEPIYHSFAKINLLLKVLRKRHDNYHEIKSLVDIISLCDTIRIREMEEDEIVIRSREGEMPEGEENIIFRAAKSIKTRFSIKKGLLIEVEKRIPKGAGLGGASSNAATVLKALVKLWNLKISLSELIDVGKSIGADVPLFIYGRPCILQGIGDVILPVRLPRIWYVIVYPGVELKTKDIYSRFKIELTKKEDDIKLRKKFDQLEDVVKILENDLERAASQVCPKIKEIKEALVTVGAKGASMTGSGSSVFGCFESEERAKDAAKIMNPYGDVFVASSV